MSNKNKVFLIIGIVVACIAIIAIVITVFVAGYIAKKDTSNMPSKEMTSSNENKITEGMINKETTNTNENIITEEENDTLKVEKNPVATIKVKDYGTIEVELYPNMAPNTVKNFIALANNGFYDGLTFHRIAKDFVIQGGDPLGNGTGGATLSDINPNIKEGTENDTEYCIKGEFKANGYSKNTISHKKGVIAMARSDYSAYFGTAPEVLAGGYNSASSQFYIMSADNTSLDDLYAPFGEVISGMDVVDKLNEVEVNPSTSKPLEPVIIEEITVETFGENYELPETMEPFDPNEYYNNIMSTSVNTGE